MNRQRLGAAVAAAALVAGVTSAPAAYAQDTGQDEKCAGLQLVLVNGTFDTSVQEVSTIDHGFGAQLAAPVLQIGNQGETRDPSGGIALENAGNVMPTNAQASDELNKQITQPGIVGTPTTTAEEDDREQLFSQAVARTYIPYSASAGGAYIPGVAQTGTVAYATSMSEGANNTAVVLEEIAAQCPNTKVFLAGHSQGAQVVSTVAREIGAGTSTISPDMIAGVALFSDPTRQAGSPVMQGGATQPAPAPGTAGRALAATGQFTAADQVELDGGGLGVDATGGKDFGALADRTASWCVPGDLVCDLPISGPLSQLVIAAAQEVELDDPQKSLEAVVDTLSPALVMNGVEDIDGDEVEFGEGGFHAQTADVQKYDRTLVGQIADATAQNNLPEGEELRAQLGSDLEKSVVGGLNALGGMALGAGMAIAKKAITPENVIQVTIAGVGGGPQAAMALAATKFAGAAGEVLTPEFAVGAAHAVLSEVEVLGVRGDALTQTVAQASGHGAAHNAYNSYPATSDGRTPIEATIDWVLAISDDISGTATSTPMQQRTPREATFDLASAQSAVAEALAWQQAMEREEQ